MSEDASLVSTLELNDGRQERVDNGRVVQCPKGRQDHNNAEQGDRLSGAVFHYRHAPSVGVLIAQFSVALRPHRNHQAS